LKHSFPTHSLIIILTELPQFLSKQNLKRWHHILGSMRNAEALQCDGVLWKVIKSSVIRTFFFMFFDANWKLDMT